MTDHTPPPMPVLYDLDVRLQRVTACADRCRYGAYAAGAVLVSQLVVRAAVAPDPDAYSSDAEELGANLASGIVNALTAPLLYASIALLAVFAVAALINHSRRTNLLAERRQLLGQPPTPPSGFGPPPQMPDRPWRPQQ